MQDVTLQKYLEILRLLAKDSDSFMHTQSSQEKLRKSSRQSSLAKSLDFLKHESSACIDILLSMTNYRYRSLRSLKNIKLGKSVLLMGNGPSASMIDWKNFRESYQDIDIAVVNFFKVPDEKLLDNIKIFVASDPNTLTNDKHRLRPDLQSERDLLINQLGSLADAHIFVPRYYLKQREIRELLSSFKCSVVSFSDTESALFGGISPLMPRSYCSMTLLKALSIVGHLGYSKIFLIGADNDYSKTVRIMPDNTTACIDQHADQPDKILPLNHYNAIDYYKSLVTLERSWSTLSRLPVCNMDPLSFVTAFPKIKPSSDFFGLIKPEYQEHIYSLEKLLR